MSKPIEAILAPKPENEQQIAAFIENLHTMVKRGA